MCVRSHSHESHKYSSVCAVGPVVPGYRLIFKLALNDHKLILDTELSKAHIYTEYT